MELNPVLKELGLTENESQVYLTLLKIGSSAVAKIAEHAKMYRPYVYDTLDRLSEKGLVSSIRKDNKKFYQAAKPEGLLDFLDKKRQALEQVLPNLNNFSKLPKEETKVELFSGKNVVRVVQKDVLNTLLKTKGESLVLGVDEQKFMETDSVIMQQFFNQMKRNKLKERVLVRAGDKYLPAHRETTTYKFLPKEFFDPTSTFIYGEKVAIVIFGEPLHAIMIESGLLANTYRKQFELLWKIAKTEA